MQPTRVPLVARTCLLMGWTGCFPQRVSLKGLTPIRRSSPWSDHGQHRTNVDVIGIDIGKDVFRIVGFA